MFASSKIRRHYSHNIIVNRAFAEQLESRTLLSGSISGILYQDANSNGLHDIGEQLLPGRTVYIDSNKNWKTDAGEASTVSDSAGHYVFSGLPAGDYFVNQLEPSGWKNVPVLNASVFTNVVDGAVATCNFGSSPVKSTLYLDTAYGTQGEIQYISPGAAFTPVVVKQADGKVVAALSTGIYRFNTDGSPDTSFNGGSPVVLPIYGDAMAVQDDGKIVVTGPGFSGILRAMRLNTNGSVDTAFGTSGASGVLLGLDSSSWSGIVKVVVNAGGQILVLGKNGSDSNGTEIALTRLTSTGQIDTSFGVGGTATAFFQDGGARPDDLVTALDGSIYIAGEFTSLNYKPSAIIVHLSASGALDSNFGINGRVLTTQIGTATPIGWSNLQINSTGNITVEGESVSAGAVQVIAAQFSSSGAIQPAFGTGGVTSVTVTGSYLVLGAGLNAVSCVDSTGRIVVAVCATDAVNAGLLTLVRLQSDGLVDQSFVDNGVGRISLSAGVDIPRMITALAADTFDVLCMTNDSWTLASARITTLAPPHDSSIAGTVYSDANGNGKIEVGDGPLSGQVLFLDTTPNGLLDVGEPTATTDSNGHYLFAQLNVGMYQIYQQLISTRRQVIPTAGKPVMVTVSTNGQAYAAGDFYDTDAPPVAAPGGPYMVKEGAAIQFNGSSSHEPAGTISTYEWDVNYNGAAFQPSVTGMTPTFSAGSIDGPATRTVALRVRDSNQVYSAIVITTVSVANVAPTATLTGSNVVSGSAGTVTFSGATDASTLDVAAGFKYSYDFNNDGTFEITDSTVASATVPASYLTKTGAHTVKGRIKDKDGGYTDYTATVQVNAAVGGFIAGTVYSDANANAKRDTGEAGVSGVTLYNDANNNSKLDTGELTTTTAADGSYSLAGLAAGSYKIRQILLTGAKQTTPANGYGWTLTLAANQQLTAKDFGQQLPVVVTTGTVTGTIFNDADGDGAKGSSETGLSGWTAFIDADNNGTKDTGELFATTDSSGNFSIASIPAGSANVRVVAAANYAATSPSPALKAVTITAGGSTAAGTFGFKSSVVSGGSITGTMFNDANANAKQDTGEPGLLGRTVYNDANNNSQLDAGEVSVTTDANGAYAFTGLAAGAYKIRQILPTGWKQTTPSGGFGWTLTLAANGSLTGKSFGTQQTTVATGASIKGTVYNDANANLKKDSTETGLSAWTAYIDTNNNSILDATELKTTTDASGVYTFAGLAAGTYKVRVVRPTGWTQTTPTSNFGQTVTVSANQSVTGKDFGEKNA